MLPLLTCISRDSQLAPSQSEQSIAEHRNLLDKLSKLKKVSSIRHSKLLKSRGAEEKNFVGHFGRTFSRTYFMCFARMWSISFMFLEDTPSNTSPKIVGQSGDDGIDSVGHSVSTSSQSAGRTGSGRTAREQKTITAKHNFILIYVLLRRKSVISQ